MAEEQPTGATSGSINVRMGRSQIIGNGLTGVALSYGYGTSGVTGTAQASIMGIAVRVSYGASTGLNLGLGLGDEAKIGYFSASLSNVSFVGLNYSFGNSLIGDSKSGLSFVASGSANILGKDVSGSYKVNLIEFTGDTGLKPLSFDMNSVQVSAQDIAEYGSVFEAKMAIGEADARAAAMASANPAQYQAPQELTDAQRAALEADDSLDGPESAYGPASYAGQNDNFGTPSMLSFSRI
jgi:hypothetical protein